MLQKIQNACAPHVLQGVSGFPEQLESTSLLLAAALTALRHALAGVLLVLVAQDLWMQQVTCVPSQIFCTNLLYVQRAQLQQYHTCCHC
jgi:uncharacterized membrane protein